MIDRKSLLVSTILAGVSASSLLICQPALAQEEPTAEDVTDVDALVVTGSRLRRNEFNTAAPVEIILTEESRLQGNNDSSSILQGSTLAAGSTQITNQFSAFVVNGGNGVNTVSLRGLGDQRTLVLLNGRRLNPAGSAGSVAAADLNVIPLAMVDRFEILKDGASSIYGSDAIGGVINIITRDDFDGITVEGSAEITEHGGGELYNGAVTFGRVRENWQIIGSLEYAKLEALKLGDRAWGVCPHEFQSAPGLPANSYGRSYADGSPYCSFTQTDYVDGLLSGDTWVWDPSAPPLSPASRSYVLFEQDLYPALPRVTNIPTDPRDRETDVLGAVERTSATLIGSLDLPNAMEFYFEGLLTNRKSEQDAYVPQFFPSDLPQVFAWTDSPFNPFPDFIQSIRTLPPAHFEQDVTASRIVLGLKGGFGGGFLSDWRWDVSGSYGKSDADYTTPVQLTDRVFNTLDYVVAPAGFDPSLVRFNPIDGISYTCAINLTDANERCYPMDVVNPSAEFANDPTLAYISHTDLGKTEYEQTILSAYADGPLFSLPAGQVLAVFGIEHREDKILDNPGAEAIAGNYFGTAGAGITSGQDEVNEIFAELEFPVIRGVPFIEELTLNLSGRYTDIETAGDDTTYKVGLNWQVIPELRIRATHGTSFRGPALYENFLASQTAFTSAADPCEDYGDVSAPGEPLYDNCASEGLDPNFTGYSGTPQVLIAGAFGRLTPETSKNTTVGVIWQPTFADLSVAVDYFDITVDNQIARLGSSNILNLCYSDPEFRTGSPYCTLVDPRDANGDIQQINDSYLNISQQVTEGFDLTVRYRRELGVGDLTLEYQGTYTTDDATELFPGSGLDDFNGTFNDPEFVWNAQAGLTRGKWTYYWATRFVGDVSYQEDSGLPISRYKMWQEDWYMHTASLRYEGDEWEAIVGLRNVFDEGPPQISNQTYWPRFGEIQALGPYDLRGRTFFVNLQKTF